MSAVIGSPLAGFSFLTAKEVSHWVSSLTLTPAPASLVTSDSTLTFFEASDPSLSLGELFLFMATATGLTIVEVEASGEASGVGG